MIRMKIGLPARSADLVKEGNVYTVTSGVCMDNCRGSVNGVEKSRPIDTGRTK
jgi:hypothetical protein